MIYLDYAATTPMLDSVKKKMAEAASSFYANASALHTPGHLAMNEIEETRERLAKLINARPNEIVFTSGSSESNNTIIRTFERENMAISAIEHHSLIEPARIFAWKMQEIPVDSNGVVKIEKSLWWEKPKLVSVCLCNNELGVMGPIGEISEVAHKNGALMHSDLTQALGKVKIDVQELGLDYATFSAHKIGGSVGVGALYVKDGAPFKPLIIGGNQEKKRRGGTYNTLGIIGFGEALRDIAERKTWELYASKVAPLRDELARRILAEIPGSSLNTPLNSGNVLPNILNASFEAAEGESIQLYLDAEGVIVSTGSACAAGDIKPSHVLMAKTGDAEVAHSSIRFSFGLESTMEDVDGVMRVLPGIIGRLQGMSTIKMKGKR